MKQNEVTVNEILSNYWVFIERERPLGWEADITLTDRVTNSEHKMVLSWTERDGYDLYMVNTGDNPLPAKLMAMADRPEFEYSLDCIMKESD